MIRLRRLLVAVVVLSGIGSAKAANYYVNDTNTIGDVFCTAPGSTNNSGASASAPAASIQQILNAYALNPGDTIYVDTGYYLLTQNVAVVSSGVSQQLITIQGAGSNTVLDGGAILASTSPIPVMCACKASCAVTPPMPLPFRSTMETTIK
jgi:hypothetical protein